MVMDLKAFDTASCNRWFRQWRWITLSLSLLRCAMSPVFFPTITAGPSLFSRTDICVFINHQSIRPAPLNFFVHFFLHYFRLAIKEFCSCGSISVGGIFCLGQTLKISGSKVNVKLHKRFVHGELWQLCSIRKYRTLWAYFKASNSFFLSNATSMPWSSAISLNTASRTVHVCWRHLSEWLFHTLLLFLPFVTHFWQRLQYIASKESSSLLNPSCLPAMVCLTAISGQIASCVQSCFLNALDLQWRNVADFWTLELSKKANGIFTENKILCKMYIINKFSVGVHC